MIEFNPKQQVVTSGSEQVPIKVVGLGGAGLNVIDRIVLDGAVHSDDLVVMNTDVQSLTSSVASRKVQLGRGVTRGLGAGGDPELGLSAAEEAQDDIRNALEGASLVFLCVGLGGGTGSGAAPLIANMAKENGSLVVVIATLPFGFEGKRRSRQAEEALIALQGSADAVICFDNDTMGDAVPPKAGIHQAFAAADETISQCVRAISGLFTQPGILHIGFDELCAALRTDSGAGRCLFGYGEAQGDNRSHEALNIALKNPLMDKGRMLDETHNVLVNVAGGPDMTLNEVQTLMEALARHTGDDTQIMFGAAVDPALTGKISVTIVSSAALALSGEAAEFTPRVTPAPAPRPAPAPPTRIVPAAPRVAAVEKPTPAPAPIEEPAEAEEEAPFEAEAEVVANAPEIPVAEAEEEQPAFVSEPDLIAAPSVVEEEPQTSLIDLAPPAPVRPALIRPRPARQPRIVSTPSDPVSQAPSKREEKQETLQFEPVTRGRFEKSEPTIIEGQDLDVPTFLRRNVKVQ
jgi:cell division protein FtsZ